MVTNASGSNTTVPGTVVTVTGAMVSNPVTDVAGRLMHQLVIEDEGIGIINATQRDNLGLVITVDDNNTQHLAWQFEIKQNMKNPDYYGGQIIVDAHNGQIIRHIKFG